MLSDLHETINKLLFFFLNLNVIFFSFEMRNKKKSMIIILWDEAMNNS